VLWHSKRQNTVEASTFGSEFIAAKKAIEMIEGLRMMGFPLICPTSALCDNQSVVTNASRPESTLFKKHIAIAYHRVREAQAAETVRFGHVAGTANWVDMLTKSMDGVKLRVNQAWIMR
jgi:hypothetical protein